MKQALTAVASVANVDIRRAALSTRRQPLFNEEIHIEEELINLEEAIKHYHLAAQTLKKYPEMRRHTLKEHLSFDFWLQSHSKLPFQGK